MPLFSRRLLLFAAALAAVAGMAAWFWAAAPSHADEALEVERGPALNPQASPYDAEITAIRFSSDPLYEGKATIFVDVRNLSSTDGPYEGKATFRVILEIDRPGDDNTVSYDLGTMEFGVPGSNGATKTFERKEYDFEETSPGRRYRFKAQVYDPGKNRMFDEESKNTSVKDATYNAHVGNISVSPSTIRQGDTATISATFTNQVKSNDGEATFDIEFQIIRPTGSPVVLRFSEDVDRTFDDDQSKTLGKRYRFQQRGIYTIKARIWNPSRTKLFKESETSVDSKTPYAARITAIRFSSDPLYEGKATIFVDVRNLSSTNGPDEGEATFRVILEIDPPGDRNTETLDLGTMEFSVPRSNGATKTFERKEYEFEETSLARRYRFNAKVYDPRETHVFYEANAETSVKEVTNKAHVGSISVSPSTVQQGDTATISATFTNQVKSNAGEATFDIDFQVIRPTGPPVVLRFDQYSDRNFDDDQSKRLEKRYRFQQRGIYTIKARIWDPSRTDLFGDSETQVDSTSPYAAQVTDIRISPSPLRVGEATIYVDVLNRSSGNGPDDGRATFDVRLEVDPPGSGNTEHPADYDADWDDVSFAANETVTLSETYPFTQATGTHTRYRLKAEVYGINGRENNWDSDHLFSDATGTENFEVADLPDLAVEIREQVTPVVGKPLTVPLILKNKGSSTSPEYSIRVAIGKPAGNLPLSEASSLVPSGNEATAGPLLQANLTGDHDLIFPNITSELNPGGHLLCVLIEYAGGEEDKDGSDNADCRAVYVLPDMGREFPGELQAFLHLDDHIQHRIDVDIDLKRLPAISIASKLLSGGELKAEDLVADRGIAGTMGLGVLGGLAGSTRVKGEIGTGSEPFWVFVPTEYSTRYEDGELKEEIEELGKEIVERTWGGLESRANRENSYQKLALEIARRGQTYGNKFVSVGVTEEDREKFERAVKLLKDNGISELPENIESLIDFGKEVVEAAELIDKVLSEVQIDPKFVQLETLHAHLEHLPLHKISDGLVVAKVVVKTVGLAGDIRITESLNRTIFVGQATHALELLEDLNVDDAAWQPAILKAQEKLKEMTSEDELQRWSAAIEDNLPNIAATYSQLALQFAAAKLAAWAVGGALTALGVASLPVTIIVVPVSIAAAWVVSEFYRISNDTHKWWDGVTLASMSAQIYSHVHTTLVEGEQDEADRIATEEIRDYLKFAFYKHLGRAAEVYDGTNIVGNGDLTQDKVHEEKRAIFHERDEVLSGVLGGDWDHTQDFKFLEDAHRPLAIWSDGTTMWVMDGESANDYIVHAFELSRKTPDEDKKLEFHPYSAFVDESFSDLWGADAGPRGIWGTNGAIWIADHDYLDVTKVFGYRIDDESKIFELPSESQGFSSPDAGLWSDGATMWFTSWTSDCGIMAFDVQMPSRDIEKSICNLAETNKRPYGLWSDGKTMWVSDVDEGRIFAYSVRTGDQAAGVSGWGDREILREIITVKVIDINEDDHPPIADNSAPTGIWSDGETMWVADRESDRIFAYTLPDSLSAPLNLTATAVGDSRVNLSWATPSDTGRAPVTGYVVQESEDGINWSTISSNTTRSGYSRTGLSDWGVRYYRVSAINRVGAGPFSNSAVAHQGFAIDGISCTPEEFYVLETVQCSATIGGIEIPGYSYLWKAQDGTAVVVTSTEDGSGGNKASVTWDTPGPKLLRVVACRTGNPTEYVNTTLADVGPATIDVGQASEGACAERTQTILVPDLVPSIYLKNPSPSALPESIGVGDSFDLEFRVGRTTWVGGPGGITVSFPDLTDNNKVSSANSYNSDQGRVRTDSENTTFAEVTYLGNGASQHLSVSAKTGDWPSPPSIPQRTLRLRIQPEEAGEFRVRVRYWLCNEDRTDDDGNPYCARYPKQDDTDNPERDQQGWATYEFTVTVVPKPEIDDLGCDSDTVDIGATVTCSPTYDGGDIDSYRWRAGYEVAGGDPSSGSDANFATKWSFSGTQTVELEVCNDISGCTSDSKSITVNPDPTETEEEEMMLEEMEEEEPDDGGRVLISGLASEWAHSSYSPTDTTIQVRALPTPDMPTLEFTLSDEDGFAPAAGDYVSPGALMLALPDDVWVDYDGISAEMLVAGTWVDYTADLEKTLLALETTSGGQQRTAQTAQGLAPASVDGSLTPPDLLAWGLGETGQAPLDDLFRATHANCVSHVTVPWLALAAQTTAVRVSIPADVSTDDYVSLALAAITAEGENGKEAALVQAHDLLDTGDATPGCEAP